MHERAANTGDENLNKQEGSLWIWRGGGSSAILFGIFPGGSNTSETIVDRLIL